ncbi:MAG: hypothetical protein NUW37_14520 [Planctomycetes bacterium]|nr:hypothetical protein [Planctomycetota bacterium]
MISYIPQLLSLLVESEAFFRHQRVDSRTAVCDFWEEISAKHLSVPPKEFGEALKIFTGSLEKETEESKAATFICEASGTWLGETSALLLGRTKKLIERDAPAEAGVPAKEVPDQTLGASYAAKIDRLRHDVEILFSRSFPSALEFSQSLFSLLSHHAADVPSIHDASHSARTALRVRFLFSGLAGRRANSSNGAGELSLLLATITSDGPFLATRNDDESVNHFLGRMLVPDVYIEGIAELVLSRESSQHLTPLLRGSRFVVLALPGKISNETRTMLETIRADHRAKYDPALRIEFFEEIFSSPENVGAAFVKLKAAAQALVRNELALRSYEDTFVPLGKGGEESFCAGTNRSESEVGGLQYRRDSRTGERQVNESEQGQILTNLGSKAFGKFYLTYQGNKDQLCKDSVASLFSGWQAPFGEELNYYATLLEDIPQELLDRLSSQKSQNTLVVRRVAPGSFLLPSHHGPAVRYDQIFFPLCFLREKKSGPLGMLVSQNARNRAEIGYALALVSSGSDAGGDFTKVRDETFVSLQGAIESIFEGYEASSVKFNLDLRKSVLRDKAVQLGSVDGIPLYLLSHDSSLTFLRETFAAAEGARKIAAVVTNFRGERVDQTLARLKLAYRDALFESKSGGGASFGSIDSQRMTEDDAEGLVLVRNLLLRIAGFVSLEPEHAGIASRGAPLAEAVSIVKRFALNFKFREGIVKFVPRMHSALEQLIFEPHRRRYVEKLARLLRTNRIRSQEGRIIRFSKPAGYFLYEVASQVEALIHHTQAFRSGRKQRLNPSGFVDV